MKAAEQRKTIPPQENDFLTQINQLLARRRNIIFLVCLAGSVLFSLLLFDARMSFATDDATYIQNALNLIKYGQYPTFQGALYPFFLVFIIKVFGFHLLLFKLCSVVFQGVTVWLLYRAFRNRVPDFILFTTLIIAAFNSYILAYASSTFSEAFYMMIQSLAILVFFQLIDRTSKPDYKPQHTIAQWLLFGFVFLLLALAKNVALFAVGAVVVYFLLKKEWLNSILAVISYAIFYIPYQLIMRALFGDISNNQAKLMLQRDFNDPSKGTVDFSDVLDRFTTNFGNYISVHTYKMFGLRGKGAWSLFTMEKMKELQAQIEPSVFLSLLFIVLFAAGLYYAWKRNRYVFFLLLLAMALAAVTFAALHTFWNQDRLIVIFLPFLFTGMVYGVYGFARARNVKWLKVVLPFVVGLLLLIQVGATFSAASAHSRATSHYLKGDFYYGYPEPLVNYLKNAQWAGENLSDSNQVVCDRPAEAIAYGHKLIFTRLPKPLPRTEDSLLMALKNKKITHLLYDATGFGPTGSVAQYLYQADSSRITPIHQEGTDPNTASILFRINY